MKNKGILLLVFLFFLFTVSLSFAGTVIVKPGRFDHFIVEFPERTVAGEGFVIKAFAYDMNNNLITNFSEGGKEFKVNVSGSATVHPSHLSAASFPGGIAHVTVTDRKAEKIVFSIYPAEGSIPAYSREIVVLPNKLDHFLVDAPSLVTAGNSFEAKIVARDAFENTVSDSELTNKSIKVVPQDSSSAKSAGTGALDFRDGVASVKLLTERTGIFSFEVLDAVSGSRGRSRNITVKPGVLGYFKIQSPAEAVAGEPFEVIVSAYDLFGNPVNDYAASGGGVILQSSGGAKIEPSVVKPSDFRNNEAVIRASYEKAEDISITAKEESKSQSGKSGPIKVRAASADHFAVTTPDNAVSGQPFKIKVEAYDRFNNIVRNFNLTGNTVMLKSTGTGILSPSIVSPSVFVEGVASVDVVYDKAESFGISAVMQPLQAAERAVRGPMPAEKASAQPAESVEKPAGVPPREKKREQVVQHPKAKKAKEEAVREAKAEQPRKETKKETKGETPGESKKETRLVSLNSISTIEAKEKAMLVLILSPEGKFEYKEEIDSKQGKNWLTIRLKPVVRKTEKSFQFKSAFIGDVFVEDDRKEPGVVNVLIELVPKKVTFDVAQLKNSLIVTVARP